MKQIEIGRKRNGRWILPIGSNVLVPSLSLSYVWEGHVDHSQSPQLLPLCVCMWLALGISPLSELSRWGVFYFFEGKERLVMLYTLFSQPTHIHTHTRWFQFPPILCVCVCVLVSFFFPVFFLLSLKNTLSGLEWKLLRQQIHTHLEEAKTFLKNIYIYFNIF